MMPILAFLGWCLTLVFATVPRYESEWRLYRWWTRRAGSAPVELHRFNRFCAELRVELASMAQEVQR